MIFIALFLFIAVNIIALNMYNSSNLDEIKEHIINQECKAIVYSKGSFKSLCDDKVLEISNSFIVDIGENSKMYYYKDMNSLDIDVKKLDIIVNDKDRISFKTKDEAYSFYEKLVKKVNNK